MSPEALAQIEAKQPESVAPELAAQRAAPAEQLPIALTRTRRQHKQPDRFGQPFSATEHPHAFILADASDADSIALDNAHHDDNACMLLCYKPSEPRIVLNFGCDYGSLLGISAMYRNTYDIGVLDVDHDPVYGGGSLADITANSVYSELLDLAHRSAFCGFILSQSCSDSALCRFKPGGPPVIRDVNHPNGIPDVPPEHARELRVSEIVCHRVNALADAIIVRKGFFVAETIASRNDS